MEKPLKRFTEKDLAKLKRQYDAMQRLAKYLPPDLAEEVRSMPVDFDDLQAKCDEMAKLEAELAIQDKEIDKAERALHRMTLAFEKEVIRQYGEDSEQARALGIKLTSNGRIMHIRPKKDGTK